VFVAPPEHREPVHDLSRAALAKAIAKLLKSEHPQLHEPSACSRIVAVWIKAQPPQDISTADHSQCAAISVIFRAAAAGVR
jgi:hypothetical protein